MLIVVGIVLKNAANISAHFRRLIVVMVRILQVENAECLQRLFDICDERLHRVDLAAVGASRVRTIDNAITH